MSTIPAITPIRVREPQNLRTILQSDCRTLLRCGMRFLTEVTVGAVSGGITGGPLGAMVGGVAGGVTARHQLGDILKELATLELPELGWVLCQRSMCHAVGELYADVACNFAEIGADSYSDSVAAGIRDALNDSKVEITVDFFQLPAAAFATRMVAKNNDLLISLGVPAGDATRLSSRIPAYFSAALRAEFRINAASYNRLLEAIETPFDKAVERQFQWLEYSDWLHRRQFEPVFDEQFCVNDIYVPLRCEWRESKNKHADGSELSPQVNPRSVGADHETSEQVRHICRLREYLLHWVEELTHSYSYKNAIRILSGGPGSGKSTSVRCFAAELRQHQPAWNVVYVPLHQFDFNDDVESALDAFCDWHEPPIPSGLLKRDARESTLLLIFDGLDELSKQGDVGAQAALAFAEHVQSWLARCDGKRQIAVLMCGRPVSANRASVRWTHETQTVHLLPYLVSISPEEKRRCEDPEKLLEGVDADQRHEWWRKFATVKGMGFDRMPNELAGKGKEFDDVTAQPLLNYLIALTYDRSLSGNSHVDFQGAINLNDVYADMLKGIWDRKYEKQQSKAIQPYDFQLYQEMLEDIALTAWHGSGRAATIESVEKHLDKKQTEALKRLTGDVSSGIMRLFLGFYVQSRRVSHGNELFEFTHKSFGEYLAAKRMIAGVGQCHAQLQQREHGGSRAGGWDEVDCLVEWSRVFGPTRLDHDINRFLRGELSSSTKSGPNYSTELLIAWRGTVVKLINVVLTSGMPMDRRTEVNAFRELNRQAISSEEALLAIHHNLSAELGRRDVPCSPSAFAWADVGSFGTWIRRLVAQRSGIETEVALASLGFIYLSGASLHCADLLGADLQHCSMKRAGASLVNLQGANLQGAQLKGAQLQGANLQGANLQGANLQRANMQGANLYRANLYRATLQGATLQGADLQFADLRDANLRDANLRDANLQDANLQDANLQDANLQDEVPQKW